LSSKENISIIAMLDFNVIVRQVMALSLERIIWYDFNGFLHVEIFVEEPFFPAKKLLDERWEVVRHGMPAHDGNLQFFGSTGGMVLNSVQCTQFSTGVGASLICSQPAPQLPATSCLQPAACNLLKSETCGSA
jgi:hypothetical protein